MQVPSSTLAIDLAAFGVLSDGPSTPEVLCRQVQLACRPWLAPTGCVIYGRLAAWLAHGAVARGDDDALALTDIGRDELKRLLLEPMDGAGHALLPLLETLKLALAERVDDSARRNVLEELMALRARCVEAQARAAVAAPAFVRRCAARRLRGAAMATDALKRDLAREAQRRELAGEFHGVAVLQPTERA